MSRADRGGDGTASLAAQPSGREDEAQRQGYRGYQGFRAVGATAARLAAPIIARRGGGALARLKAEWAGVVGAESAAASWPMKLGRDGTLSLRVAPAAALELQHRAPLLIERINLYLGRAAVGRLKLVQGPLPLAPPRRPPPPQRLDPAEVAALEARLSMLPGTELRAALARLGRAVIAAEKSADASSVAFGHETD